MANPAVYRQERCESRDFPDIEGYVDIVLNRYREWRRRLIGHGIFPILLF
jgi:hypothetical protein